MGRFRSSLQWEMMVVSQGSVTHLALLGIQIGLVSRVLASLRGPVSSSGLPSTRHGHTGETPAKNHKGDKGTGASLL